MKARSVHGFEPGEIPSTLRHLSARCRNLAEQATKASAEVLAGELSECGIVLGRYAAGIDDGVQVALAGETVDLLLILSLVEESLQEITALAHQWPLISITPDVLQQPLSALAQQLEDLLHNIKLIRAAIPPTTTDATLSA